MCEWCCYVLRTFAVLAVLVVLLEHYQRYFSTCRSPFAAPVNGTALPCAPPHDWIAAAVACLDYAIFWLVVAHVALVYVLALAHSSWPSWSSSSSSGAVSAEGKTVMTRNVKKKKNNGRKRSVRCGSEIQTAGDNSSN